MLESSKKPHGVLHSTFHEAMLLSILEDDDLSSQEKVSKIEGIFHKISSLEKKSGLSVQGRMNEHIVSKASSVITRVSMIG